MLVLSLFFHMTHIGDLIFSKQVCAVLLFIRKRLPNKEFLICAGARSLPQKASIGAVPSSHVAVHLPAYTKLEPNKFEGELISRLIILYFL